jgi:hypothetical protein
MRIYPHFSWVHANEGEEWLDFWNTHLRYFEMMQTALHRIVLLCISTVSVLEFSLFYILGNIWFNQNFIVFLYVCYVCLDVSFLSSYPNFLSNFHLGCVLLSNFVHTYVHIHTYICIYTCVYIYTYICIYTCVYIYTCEYIYIWQIFYLLSPLLITHLIVYADEQKLIILIWDIWSNCKIILFISYLKCFSILRL